jgi:hypothetical protein
MWICFAALSETRETRKGDQLNKEANQDGEGTDTNAYGVLFVSERGALDCLATILDHEVLHNDHDDHDQNKESVLEYPFKHIEF